MPLAAWVTARTPASEQATFACLTPGLSDALGLQRLRFAGQRLADNQCGKNADIHGEENQGKAPAQPGTPQPPSSSLPMGRASRQKEAASILERPFIGRRKHADVTGFAGWLLLFHMPSDLPLFCRARTDAFGKFKYKRECSPTVDAECGCKDGHRCFGKDCSKCVENCGVGEEPLEEGKDLQVVTISIAVTGAVVVCIMFLLPLYVCLSICDKKKLPAMFKKMNVTPEQSTQEEDACSCRFPEEEQGDCDDCSKSKLFKDSLVN
ncbi:Tumor necrosis factor receptor superfamily member 9 [Chelonia mydas]|uniref:Tumor necrosis factor receptor superfamily member 9 n=1 Tax=Chelonia mydas TaxID=8469 RepID=M7BDM5_CHEMY|nr:Tumor necrosis factor receptor superfamily member 9 [Chelonia mydas]